jgi:hypothetical protein
VEFTPDAAGDRELLTVVGLKPQARAGPVAQLASRDCAWWSGCDAQLPRMREPHRINRCA